MFKININDNVGGGLLRVEFLVLQNGRNPFEDWLNSLDISVRARIFAQLERMRRFWTGIQNILRRLKRIGEHIMFRTKSFDEMLSAQLRQPEFAKCYLMALMEGKDGLDLFPALKRAIKQMGIKEFSELSGIASPGISRLLAQDEPPKVQTLNKMLKPFGLRVKIDVEDVA